MWCPKCHSHGFSQLEFHREQPPPEDGQAEIISKEVPGEDLWGGDRVCSVSGFSWVFPLASMIMGSKARAAGV